MNNVNGVGSIVKPTNAILAPRDGCESMVISAYAVLPGSQIKEEFVGISNSRVMIVPVLEIKPPLGLNVIVVPFRLTEKVTRQLKSTNNLVTNFLG